MAVGWWIYDRGYNDSLPGWHEGFDRTHLAVIFPAEFELSFRGNNWFVETGTGIRSLRDNVMITPEDKRSDRERYRISPGQAVSIQMFYLRGGYNVFGSPGYSFTPALTLGTFTINTTHPNKDQFRHKLYYEAGIMNQFHIHKRFDLLIFPRYSNMIITTQPDAPEGSGHNIHSIGINMGFRCWII